MPKDKVIDLLQQHGHEIWEGYVVEVYMKNGILGESFKHLDDFKTISQVYEWLGY